VKVELGLKLEEELGVWSIDRSGVIGDLECGGSGRHVLRGIEYFKIVIYLRTCRMVSISILEIFKPFSLSLADAVIKVL
jgi:hypothetical protein